jgi:hypothetical protein
MIVVRRIESGALQLLSFKTHGFANFVALLRFSLVQSKDVPLLPER